MKQFLIGLIIGIMGGITFISWFIVTYSPCESAIQKQICVK